MMRTITRPPESNQAAPVNIPFLPLHPGITITTGDKWPLVGIVLLLRPPPVGGIGLNGAEGTKRP